MSMKNAGRPLSPHLTVYRWPITMTLSILHRMSGVALSAGLVVLVLWLAAAAGGEPGYRLFSEVVDSAFGRLLMVAWTFAFFFHLANGVRHLVWDSGHGFENRQANASAWIVVACTVILTAAYWLAL